jgi:hypothetical protein
LRLSDSAGDSLVVRLQNIMMYVLGLTRGMFLLGKTLSLQFRETTFLFLQNGAKTRSRLTQSLKVTKPIIPYSKLFPIICSFEAYVFNMMDMQS